MEKQLQVSVRVHNAAFLDAAADALSDRGMVVFFRKRVKSEGLVVGEIASSRLSSLMLVGGCDVRRD